MDRKIKLVIATAVGPAVLTIAFVTVAFGLLYVLGFRYSSEQIARGAIIFFLCCQLPALWLLWKSWTR